MHTNDPITKSVSNAYIKMKAEELSAKQKKHIDKNNNNKIDSHDFKLLRKEEDEVEEGWDDMMKAVKAKSGPQPSGGKPAIILAATSATSRICLLSEYISFLLV